MTITVSVNNFTLPEAVQRGAQTILDDPIDDAPGWAGTSQRNRKNTHRPRQLTIGYGVKTQADRQTIIDAWMFQGKLKCFLFRDPLENTLTAERIDLVGVGPTSLSDGANLNFPIKRTYAGGSLFYERRLTRPVDDGSIVVTVDGVTISSSNYTIQPLGILSFNSGHAPAAGKAVRITCKFLIVVRFIGKWAYRVDTLLKVSVPTAQLQEEFEA